VRLAEFAGRPFKREYGVALRLYLDAFAADPAVLPTYRYGAAAAALQVAAGRAPGVRAGPDEWFELNRLAAGWLTDELAMLRQAASGRPADRAEVARILDIWLRDPDLLPVRDPAWLAVMPADPRREWEALWEQVRATRGGRTDAPPQPASPAGPTG
jgi:hypothetical protein